MSNPYFQFKQFTIYQDRCAMKVTTDACLFGAYVADAIAGRKAEIRSVLDVGTGTGLLSLMFAQKNPSTVIDAIEIDNEASGQAKQNVSGSPFRDRIRVINGDVRTVVFENKYDVIISNPPFYENELKSAQHLKNIAHHHSGLLLQDLLTFVKANLNTNGYFYLLLPYKRNDEIKKLLLQNEFNISRLILVKQSTRHDYFRIILEGTLKGQEDLETEFDEMSIWNDKEEYTEEFKRLLKDYYLHL